MVAKPIETTSSRLYLVGPQHIRPSDRERIRNPVESWSYAMSLASIAVELAGKLGFAEGQVNAHLIRVPRGSLPYDAVFQEYLTDKSQISTVEKKAVETARKALPGGESAGRTPEAPEEQQYLQALEHLVAPIPIQEYYLIPEDIMEAGSTIKILIEGLVRKCLAAGAPVPRFSIFVPLAREDHLPENRYTAGNIQHWIDMLAHRLRIDGKLQVDVVTTGFFPSGERVPDHGEIHPIITEAYGQYFPHQAFEVLKALQMQDPYREAPAQHMQRRRPFQ